MNKKFMATLLALSMLTSTVIAYGDVESGRDVEKTSQEVIQGVPGGIGEDLEGRVAYQGSEEIESDPGDSRGDSEGVRVELREVEITEGEVTFGNNNYNISNSKSVDFPGTFNVDAAAGNVSGAPVRLTNTGETELIVYAEKCKSMDNTSPSIVSPNTFSDWMNLSQEETVSNMALGFIINGTTTYWFNDEGSQQSEEVYRLAVGESITLAITGKTGTQWPQNCTIDYDCTIGFEVIPLIITEEIETPEEIEMPETPEEIETPTDDTNENIDEVEQPDHTDNETANPDNTEQLDTSDDTTQSDNTSEEEQQPDGTDQETEGNIDEGTGTDDSQSTNQTEQNSQEQKPDSTQAENDEAPEIDQTEQTEQEQTEQASDTNIAE